MKLFNLTLAFVPLLSGSVDYLGQSASGTEYVNPTAEVRIVKFNANRVCALLSGVPYKTTTVETKKWQDFVDCMILMRDVNGVLD
jgi:hypothetical protein